jgi:hypothetical protein
MKSLTSIMGLIAGLAGGIAIFLIQLQGGGNLDGVLLEPRSDQPSKAPTSPREFLLIEPTDTPADATQPSSSESSDAGIEWVFVLVSSTLGAIVSGVVGALTGIAINRFIPGLEKA